MRLITWLALALLLAAMPAAVRAQTCTYAASSVNFGLIAGNPTSVQDTTGTIRVTCSGITGRTVRVCLGIPDGSGGNSLADRRMLSGGNFVQYQIYKDAARSQIWGQRNQAQTPLTLDIPLTAATGNVGTATMYGRIFAGQTKPAGTYQSAFTNGANRAEGRIGYVVNATNPNCATFGGTRQRFGFSAAVGIGSVCTVTAADIDFGDTASLATAINGTGSLQVSCTSGAGYTIAMDGGTTTGNIANRRMDKVGAGTGSIGYQLYRDLARTQIWGNGATGTVQPGTGTGTIQTIPVFARVPSQATPAADDYLDVVTVTLSY